MKAQYRFKNLIRKYNAPFTIYEQTEGHHDSNTGKWVKGAEIQKSKYGCIVPYAEKTIFQSGGTILQSDRQIICLEKLQNKAKILYRDKFYTVLEETPYEEYGDFFIYHARRVDSFDNT